MISNIIDYLNTLSKESPFIGNTITLMITGGIGMIIWKWPLKIYEMIKKHFIMEYTVSNAAFNDDSPFPTIVKWYILHDGWKYTRSRSHQYSRNSSCVYGVGDGIHYFKYKNWFYQLKIYNLDSSGSEYSKKELKIKTVGIRLSIIDNLVSDIKDTMRLYKRNRRSLITYRPSGECEDTWYDIVRPLSSIVVDDVVKHKVFDRVKSFRASRDWYRDVGIPYKLGIILYGYTGTGKTSIIKALSTEFNLNIHIVPLYDMSELGLARAIENVGTNSILVLEDFDTCRSVKKRSGVTDNVIEKIDRSTKDKKQGDSLGEMFGDYSAMNLSGILNLLDGIRELDNVIIIATTNDINGIDPALIRPGRFDVVVEVKPLSKKYIIEYTNKVYNTNLTDIDILVDVPVPAANLQGIFLENVDDIDGYIAGVNKYQNEQLESYESGIN